MRALILITLAGLASPATAQKVWTDAPVPNVRSATVAPAVPAGDNGGSVTAGPVNSTPFSGPPPEQSGAQTNTDGRGDARSGTEQGTPTLSR